LNFSHLVPTIRAVTIIFPPFAWGSTPTELQALQALQTSLEAALQGATPAQALRAHVCTVT